MGLTKAAKNNLATLAKVRRNARKDARSGNPAKRVPAKRALAEIPGLIRDIHRRANR